MGRGYGFFSKEDIQVTDRNMEICFSRVLVGVFYISDHAICKEEFHFFLPDLSAFPFLSCPIALASTFSITLTRVVRVDIFSCF